MRAHEKNVCYCFKQRWHGHKGCVIGEPLVIVLVNRLFPYAGICIVENVCACACVCVCVCVKDFLCVSAVEF